MLTSDKNRLFKDKIMKKMTETLKKLPRSVQSFCVSCCGLRCGLAGGSDILDGFRDRIMRCF